MHDIESNRKWEKQDMTNKGRYTWDNSRCGMIRQKVLPQGR
jgi:hypothetical protein